MTKSELIDQLAKEYPHLYHRDIEKVVDVFYNSIAEALSQGQRVEIRGFGRFKTVIRKARLGRNPKNSETIQIPSKKAIKWKMSRKMYLRLNKNFTENKISAN